MAHFISNTLLRNQTQFIFAVLYNVCKTLSLGGVAVLFSYAHQRYLDSATEKQNMMYHADVGMKQTYLLCLSNFFSQANGIANLQRRNACKVPFSSALVFCSLIKSKPHCQCRFNYA